MHERELERKHRDHESAADDHATPGRANASAGLQRRAEPQASGILMRKSNGGDIDSGAATAVDAAAGGSGQGLPDDLRGKFEDSLGTDLSSVRVHTGAESATAAEAVGARAYAVGDNIHFGQDQYDPHSTDGQHLIAHEVAHTVQQRGSAPTRQNKLAVSDAGDGFEIEADRAASAMVGGAPAQVTGGGSGVIARKGAPGADKKPGAVSTDKANWAEKSIDMKLLGKKATFQLTEGGVKGSLQLTNLPPATATLAKFDHDINIPVSPGVGVLVKLSGDVKMEAAANATMKGGPKEFPGPREDNIGYEASVSGTGSLSFSATGRMAVVGYVGAAFANINAGGYVTLGAKAKSALTITGGLEASPEGTISGSAGMTVDKSITVTGTGGLTVGWEALIASGTFYEVELASHDFFTMGVKINPQYDFATGTVSSDAPIITKPAWKPITFTKPKQLKANKGMKNAADRAQQAVDKLKAAEKKKGTDIDGQQSILRDEDKKKSTDETDCDPETTSCEE